MPHKALPSVAKDVSPADEITAISPATNNEAAASSDFSALGDVSKDTPSTPSSQAEEVKNKEEQPQNKPETKKAAGKKPKSDTKESVRKTQKADNSASSNKIESDDFFNDNTPASQLKQIDSGLRIGETYGVDKVRELYDRYATDKEQKKLADRVFAIAGKLNLKVSFMHTDLGWNVGGAVNGDQVKYARITTLEQNKDKLPNVLLHEMIHAVTIYAIDAHNNGESKDENLIKAVDSINEVYEQVKSNESLKGEYGLKNAKEMIAEMANPSFRAKLKHINVWDKLKDAIKRLFFFDEPSQITANKVLSDALDKLLDNFDYSLFDTYERGSSSGFDPKEWDFYKTQGDSNKEVRQHKAEQAPTATTEDTALRDALAELMQQSGMEVFVNEKAQQVLDEVNGNGAQIRLQAMIKGLNKASNFILSVLKGQTKQRKAKIEIPELANRLAEKTLKHPINSHSINANEIVHIKKRHGENGTANNSNSIPLRDEDISLMPYIMAAPTKVVKGSTAVNGTESVRYEKELENGYVVVVEREGRFDVEDMENITMWAQKKPATNVTVATRTSHSTSETIVISEADVAKIKKDAEDAIRKEEKLREHRVFHGSSADFDAFDHFRFFRTPNGHAYGFTVDGKIYLDPRIATAETAIHEYAHLWADMLRQMNPEAWNDIVQLMKGTSVWDEVKSLYPELKTDDEIADEVLAHYSGRQGAAKLSEEQHRIAHDQNMDLRSKATAIAALDRIKQALTKFWKGVADLLHIRFTTAEEVADRVLADLLHGVNPTAYAKRTDGKVRKMGTRVNRYMANIASHFSEAKLTPSQQAVIDVYSGKSDNQAISVEREDGKRKVVMRQGNENHAGTKHSLFRHFNRNEGTIMADDMLLIPQVLEKGEVKIVKNGKGRLYTLEKDGVKYKVYTEINSKNNKEEFCDFYTNKKVQGANSYISLEDAQNGNTQLSARITSPQTAANVAQSPDTSNTLQRENAEIPSKDAQISESSNGGTLYSEGEKINEQQVLSLLKQRVIELFRKSLSKEFTGKPISIGRLSVDGKKYLEKLSGLKFKEFVDFVLNPSDLNHIHSDHYGQNEKDKGNNVPLTDQDIQNMVEVLNKPDAILYGVDKKDGRKLFFFLKDAGNGLYNLTEVCSTKKGNLTAKSFFKSKKKGISQRVMEIKDSLLPTSVTYSGEFLSSEAKIPKLFEINEISSDNVVNNGIMFREGQELNSPQITEAANRAAGSLHLDNVTILGEEDLASLTPKQQRAKGWFDPQTGRIYINASNHANEADVVQTVLHEAVAHFGLRALFGKDFDTMLDKFYRAADSNIHKGNPLNEDGTLKVEKINAIDELTDEYFSNPTRNVQLPALPQNVDNTIDANGKPVVIKKNIFKKNKKSHKDVTASQSRQILTEALYNTNMYGKIKKIQGHTIGY